MSARTRQRPAVGEPGAVKDRTSRTINFDWNSTAGVETGEFVEDAEATGDTVTAADHFWLTVRFGSHVAEAVASGELECRRNPETCEWFFRTAEMRNVRVHDITPAMRERYRQFLTGSVNLTEPCTVACSPAACSCPSREVS